MRRRSLHHPAAHWILLFVVASCGSALAQYRADGQPVVTPEPAPKPKPVIDVAPKFAEAYRRAGQPRIVLMWNREFSDKTQTELVEKQVTRETGKASDSSMDKTTQGAGESAVLQESDQSYDRSKSVSTSSIAVEDVRTVALAERHAAMLQRGFVAEMGRGGVRFIDRALVMRKTASTQHRSGGDPKLIETDALLRHGDLLMEVVLIEDKDTPAGYGFDVRVKDLQRGQDVSSLYSRAIPVMPALQPSTWVPGESGYELRPRAAPLAPSAAEVGAALGRDVMVVLGGNLKPMSSALGRQR